jgi:hypothetical protein
MHRHVRCSFVELSGIQRVSDRIMSRGQDVTFIMAEQITS